MKKVVLVLDGIIAKEFLKIVLEKYFSANEYCVVTLDKDLIPSNYPNNFHFFNFDPSSTFKLHGILSHEVSDVFIVLECEDLTKAVLNIVRDFNPDIRIVLNSKQKRISDENTLIIDDNSLIANSIISKLPNVPLIPQGFGLGIGEIMEINVPLGSAFAYRHIGSIHQKNYKIIGLYRQNELILSTHNLVIRPNDTLLVAGNPNTLSLIYRQVKSDIGQFPAPFGNDIYLYVDMRVQKKSDINNDINQALFMQNALKNTKLHICILNPNDFDFIKQTCLLESESIKIEIDYQGLDFLKKLKQDISKKIGMLVISNKFFSKKRVRKTLFNAQIPVFKTSKNSLDAIKSCIVILKEDMRNQENISSVIFDIAIQTKLDILLYDFDPDGNFQNEIHNEYQNISRMLDKKVEIKKTKSKNPILFLKNMPEPMLHFLPFERCVASYKTPLFLSTNVEKISLNINSNPQIFIPVPN